MNQHFDRTVRAAVETTKQRIRERIIEESQKIAEEEVGNLFANLKFDMHLSSEAFDNAVNVSLIVKGAGEMWQNEKRT